LKYYLFNILKKIFILLYYNIIFYYILFYFILFNNEDDTNFRNFEIKNLKFIGIYYFILNKDIFIFNFFFFSFFSFLLLNNTFFYLKRKKKF